MCAEMAQCLKKIVFHKMYVVPEILEKDVSRETLAQLQEYHQLLLKWQKKINLISPNTVSNAWERHFVDSMQIAQYIENKDIQLVDLGSGAGFPGLVLAIMGIKDVILVESDRRKVIFMKEVVRQLRLKNVTIYNDRIENIIDIKADMITARALASLKQLLEWVKPFLKPKTRLIFPKGRHFEDELAELNLSKEVDLQIFDSLTDPEAKIISLGGLFLK